MSKSGALVQTVAAAAALAAASCTDGQIGQDELSRDVDVVSYEIRSQVPTCDASHYSQVYYVRSEDRFFYCDGRSLQKVDLQGRPSKDGKLLVTVSEAPTE